MCLRARREREREKEKNELWLRERETKTNQKGVALFFEEKEIVSTDRAQKGDKTKKER